MFTVKKPALLLYLFMVVGWNFNDHGGGNVVTQFSFFVVDCDWRTCVLDQLLFQCFVLQLILCLFKDVHL